MQKVMSVFDSKVEGYLPPQVFVTVAVAVRSFKFAANSEGNDFSRFAADYTLFEIGEWDDQAGTMQMHEAKVNHGTALEHQQVVVEVPAGRARGIQGGE